MFSSCKFCFGSAVQLVLELLHSCIFWRSTVDTFQGPVPPPLPKNFQLEPPLATRDKIVMKSQVLSISFQQKYTR